MTPQDPLQALHPLREPVAVGWWPPAPGWWIVAALFLALIVSLAVWWWRRHRRDRYRRQALDELVALRTTLSGSERVQQVNAILKRSALMAYSAKRVAALAGDDWIRFLNTTLPRNSEAFSGKDGDILYTPDPSSARAEAFTEAACIWVRHHQREPGDA